ncbi:MAG: cytochrome c oxidase assembly protein [Candidatus Rokubacteria bacterium]|nr:cytochrome c oxidase assembly protein [Candidatus Rokubacteria bacterium]
MGASRLEVALPLLLVASLYLRGAWRLSRRAPRAFPAWRLLPALGGLSAVGVALLSPLARLAHDLFAAHMVQHFLLVMVAAPALLLADPLAAVLWALPAAVRPRVGRLLAPRKALRRAWARLTWMPVAWLVGALVLWLWHLPPAWERALASAFLHDAEHLAFFGSAILFWWPVVHPAPRVRPAASLPARIAYLVLAAFQQALLGLLLTLAPWPLYPSHAARADALGWTALEDQAWGGMIMWGAGSAIAMAAVLVLLARFFGAGERGSLRPFLDRSPGVGDN